MNKVEMGIMANYGKTILVGSPLLDLNFGRVMGARFS